ncbi:hypothetical protein JXB41_02070 [Candidatus Woesearchaeota archaeon]|nr:hypothetical protein [Candidatus Woesearchaeota archaeon]
MKCSICKNKVNETFLKKIIGTYIKDKKGKRLPICSKCQTKFNNDKEKMIAEIK